jgi:soluble cytochrome b562
VEKVAGEDNAPKITGMLIDLPIEEIKGYLHDFNRLVEKINEAKNLLGTTQ